MISRFLREQKRYSQKDLCSILECSEEKVVHLIQKLKEYGVLKSVKALNSQQDMTDLSEEDIEVSDVEAGENEYLYVSTFVGVIIVYGYVLKCFPKYILSDSKPKKELRKIIKVLEKYNSKKQIIRIFNDSSESKTFNLLAVLLFLLQDYYESGIYRNTDTIIETNGSGEIIWDKTINETFTLLSNNRPYYTNLQTRRRITDDFDYFQRLHECVLTKASKELYDADLLDLFEITDVQLSSEQLDDFGSRDYILNRIENELNIQYNTRKQIILKTIYSYIYHGASLKDTDCLSMFGTNNFNLVWETACAEILDNQLDVQLSELCLPVPLGVAYSKTMRLIEIIEKPLWSATGETATDTLIPDIITIIMERGESKFLIFDAKYYCAHLEPNKQPKAQPGIDSITKQYLYQLAFQRFIKDHKFQSVKNCFLMPTEKEEIVNKGEVSLKMLSTLGLQNIMVRYLPAEMVYDYFLSNKKMSISKLHLL